MPSPTPRAPALPLVIACGDFAGIGPEVSLRAVARASLRESHRRFVLVGDRNHVLHTRNCLGLDLPIGPEHAVQLLDPRSEPLPAQLAPGGAVSALAALDYLRRAAEGCRSGEFAALITAPVSKEAILRAGVRFVGQTEFLAELAGGPEVSMMLLGDDPGGRWLRVVLATTHLPLRLVPDALTVPVIERAIRNAAEACRLLRLPRARVAVCGLNPHAGEGGLLGDEDVRVIAPAVAATRARGIDVTGPLSGDTVFHQAWRGDYDVVVAMYHDQGLAPLKLVAFDRGVNWTLGLPFVRTSPDHGTAFDIAGRGVADASSMDAAVRLAIQLVPPSERP